LKLFFVYLAIKKTPQINPRTQNKAPLMKSLLPKEPRARKALLNAFAWGVAILTLSLILSDSEHRHWVFMSMIIGWTISNMVIQRCSKMDT